VSALQKIPSDLLSLPIYGTAIDSADDVRDLGVWLDSELTMKHHISKIISVCFYHIGRLRQLRDKVSQDTMRQLVTSLVLSRIDYCNTVLAGLRASTFAPLQRVQNAAARLVLRLDRWSHITAALRELHWLPVKYRIQVTIAVFVHQVTTQQCPLYVAGLVAFCLSDSRQRPLRSASTLAAIVQQKRTDYGR